MARTYQRRSSARRSSARRSSARALRPVSRERLALPAAPKKKRNFKKGVLRSRLLRWTGIVLLCFLVAVLAFAVGGYLGLMRAVDSLEEPSAVTSHPTYVYSAPVGETAGSSRVIGSIFRGENRRTAPLDKIPPSLLDALVAKEDERFREHGGVDLWGIIRALWVDALIVTDLRSGEDLEGQARSPSST